MKYVIEFLRPIALWLSRGLFRIEFRGVENIPAEGACIITPNHQAYADPIWLTIPIRRRVYYMAWARMFEIPVLGTVMRVFGAFPVKLESADKAAQREAIELIRRGAALVIFPEGSRTPTGKLMDFKAGAFRLALMHGVMILPVTIEGGYEIWPRHRRLPRTGTLRITYHPVIEVTCVSEELSRLEIKARAKELAEQTRAIVASSLETVSKKDQQVLLNS